MNFHGICLSPHSHRIATTRRARGMLTAPIGGGYVFPAAPEMFEFMFQIVDALSKQGKSVAVLFLSYDLAPGAIYPRQLQQAATILNHVLKHLNIDPQNIFITSDSAGANLALSLLSHITHPHPSGTVPKVELKNPIAGAVFISPWVEFHTDAPSYTTNKYKDCIGTGGLSQWSSAFLGEPYPHASKRDYYNQAVTAPESWWEGLPVDKVLVVAGEEEVFLDDIVKFEKKLSKGMGEGKVEFVAFKNEFHDYPSINLKLGYKESDEGESAKLIKNWINSKL
jgi:acetyl esterase/lipase